MGAEDLPPDWMNIEPCKTDTGRRMDFEEHPLDVILLVKRFAFDTTVAQAPQVVLPHQLLSQFFRKRGRIPTALRPCNPPGEMAEKWLLCAQSLLEFFPMGSMQRSVRYLQQLAAGQRGCCNNFPPLNWTYSCVGRPEAKAVLDNEVNYLPVIVPALKTRVYFRRRAVQQLREDEG